MELQNDKCVMILDETLPKGIAANTAAILGVTMGKEHPGAVGGRVTDKNGGSHPGIIAIPVPVLKGNQEIIRGIREKLTRPEFDAVTAVDFSDLAQGCNTYPEFEEKMAATPEEGLRYLGIALYGAKRQIDRLTGSLPLLR